MMLEYQEVYRHPRVGKRTIQAVWEMGKKNEADCYRKAELD